MALSLSISEPVQSNDNTILRITDDTGVYSDTNITGWGTPNTDITTVDGTTNSLSIIITITNSSGIETVYEPIDVYDYLGHAPTTTADLVIDVTCDMLIEAGSSTAMGTDEDELPDGWYSIEYKLTNISTSVTVSTTTIYFLVKGSVRSKLYDMLRYIPRTSYESTPYRMYTDNWDQLTFPLYILSLYDSMNSYVTLSRKNEILNMLNYIERLTT